MVRTRAVLVDLDNTLLDFDRSERLALRTALVALDLPCPRPTLELYRRINAELWHRYSLGELSGGFVAQERFRLLLARLGGDPRRGPALGRAYLAQLSRRGDTLPRARRALARLRRRFALAVVTNGYERVQRARLRAGRLTGYFDTIVTSEGCGHAKPHPRMVEVALDALRVEARDALYVGDDLHTDRGAARAAGVAFVWIDHGRPLPAGVARPRRAVASLDELADRLGC